MSAISRLPLDIHYNIFNTFLSFEDLHSAAQTCRTWSQIVSDRNSWAAIAKHRGITEELLTKIKNHYQELRKCVRKFNKDQGDILVRFRTVMQQVKNTQDLSSLGRLINFDLSVDLGITEELLPLFAERSRNEDPVVVNLDFRTFCQTALKPPNGNLQESPKRLQTLLNYSEKITDTSLNTILGNAVKSGIKENVALVLRHHQRIYNAILEELLGTACKLIGPNQDAVGIATLLLEHRARISNRSFYLTFEKLLLHPRKNSTQLCRLFLTYPDKIDNPSLEALLARSIKSENIEAADLLLQHCKKTLGNAFGAVYERAVLYAFRYSSTEMVALIRAFDQPAQEEKKEEPRGEKRQRVAPSSKSRPLKREKSSPLS